MELQQPALDAFDDLCRTFEHDSYGNVIYPDDFAGEYVDTEKDFALVIRVTDLSSETVQSYLSRIPDAEHVRFELGVFSINELLFWRDNLREFMEEKGFPVVLSGIDHRKGELVVQLNEEQKEAFLQAEAYRELSKILEENNLPVTIQFGPQAERTATTLKGGYAITNSSYTVNGSHPSLTIGFGGSFSISGNTYSNCILTCGHDSYLTHFFTFFDGETTSTIGQVIFSRYSSSPSYFTEGDFSVINLNNNFTKSNKVLGANAAQVSISAYYSSSPSSGTYYKYGATTGFSSGSVYLSDVQMGTGGTNTTYVNHLIALTIQPGELSTGDSGGPVYTSINNSSNKKAMGIITAKGNPIGCDNEYLLVTPVWQPIAAGFTPATT